MISTMIESGASPLPCNSAAAACLHDARERYPVPVVEVIRPAVRRAVAATRNGHIGVISTRATINSRAYEDAFAAAPHVTITSAACPQFVEFVERGITSGRALLGLAQSYLEPLQRVIFRLEILGHAAVLVDAAAERHADQLAAQIIGPLVIGTHELARVAMILLTELHAAMGAAIDEGLDLAGIAMVGQDAEERRGLGRRPGFSFLSSRGGGSTPHGPGRVFSRGVALGDAVRRVVGPAGAAG